MLAIIADGERLKAQQPSRHSGTTRSAEPGIHFDIALPSKAKMDPGFRWDDEHEVVRCSNSPDEAKGRPELRTFLMGHNRRGLGMDAIVSAMLYLIIATVVYSFFYAFEDAKKALTGFILIMVLLLFRYLWYRFVSEKLLFPYMPDWFYPGALIACLTGGIIGLIHVLYHKKRN